MNLLTRRRTVKSNRELKAGFAEVLASLKESGEQHKEIAREHKEIAREHKEFDRQMQEIAQEHKEIAREQKENDRAIKRLNKQMGDLHRRFGDMAAHLVAPGIEARFSEMGFHIDDSVRHGREIKDGRGNILAEIDLELENGEYIIAVEIKATVRLTDVEHHIKRLEILKAHRERRGDKPKKILGAIAGAIFESAERQAVIEAGFYALVQSGDTMKMAIPPDFVPRVW